SLSLRETGRRQQTRGVEHTHRRFASCAELAPHLATVEKCHDVILQRATNTNLRQQPSLRLAEPRQRPFAGPQSALRQPAQPLISLQSTASNRHPAKRFLT